MESWHASDVPSQYEPADRTHIIPTVLILLRSDHADRPRTGGGEDF